MTMTAVRFPGELLERIDALVGKSQAETGKEPRHRAKFIRDAVTAEVERQERVKSAKPD